MDIDFHVHADGHLFTIMGPIIVADYVETAVDEVAQKGKDQVDRTLAIVIRHPTPIYQTRIQIERAGNDRIINDAGMIYGPWLEGVGTRNKTTRFKGYFTFRKTKQWLDVESDKIAQVVLIRFIKELRS